MDDPKLKAEGKKWIRHFGCAGCHEISGFEEEGRIGTELTEEGSKPIERLDFALLTKKAEDRQGAHHRQGHSGAPARGPSHEATGTTTRASSSTSWPCPTSTIRA